MKEFKTLGPTQFGVGDGVKTRFSVARPGDIVRDSNIESVRRVGWQGDQLLHPYPRTNLAIASNDFTNSAWQGSPSLYIDFLSGTMPSSVGFSRASTATYVGRDRLIHTAAINEPRFTYDPMTGESLGLLVEGQATNLLPWSEDFTQWTYNRIVITQGGVVAPDGSPKGSKVESDGTEGSVYLRVFGDAAIVGQPYTVSVYAKRSELSEFEIRFRNISSSLPGVIFDIDNGTASVSSGALDAYGIEGVGGGWYRCYASLTAEVSDTLFAWIYLGGNVQGGNGIYIWGAQLEEGTHPTSYIPTEGSQVTRIADTPIIPVGDWFNPDEGTFVVEGEAQPRGTSADENIATLLKVGDSLTSPDALVIDRAGKANNYFARTRTSDGGPWALGLGNSSGIVKIAASYTAGGDMRGVLNGGDVVTGTNGWDGTGDFLYIGAGGLQGAGRTLRRANGPISRITYYPRALSNAELQALTS